MKPKTVAIVGGTAVGLLGIGSLAKWKYQSDDSSHTQVHLLTDDHRSMLKALQSFYAKAKTWTDQGKYEKVVLCTVIWMDRAEKLISEVTVLINDSPEKERYSKKIRDLRLFLEDVEVVAVSIENLHNSVVNVV